jgi:hypothetical protein
LAERHIAHNPDGAIEQTMSVPVSKANEALTGLGPCACAAITSAHRVIDDPPRSVGSAQYLLRVAAYDALHARVYNDEALAILAGLQGLADTRQHRQLNKRIVASMAMDLRQEDVWLARDKVASVIAYWGQLHWVVEDEDGLLEPQ